METPIVATPHSGAHEDMEDDGAQEASADQSLQPTRGAAEQSTAYAAVAALLRPPPPPPQPSTAAAAAGASMSAAARGTTPSETAAGEDAGPSKKVRRRGADLSVLFRDVLHPRRVNITPKHSH